MLENYITQNTLERKYSISDESSVT